jgi:hypothetical protein
MVGAITVPIATLYFTEFFESWKSSHLVFRSTETILINGRVVDADVVNTGSRPAKDVVVSLKSYPPTFEFNTDHVHTDPALPFATTHSQGRLEVKLTSPLGPGQWVNIIVDELRVKENSDPMFQVGVSFDGGIAERQAHLVRSHPKLTLDEFLTREVRDPDRKTL